jgi:hypothetical protein
MFLASARRISNVSLFRTSLTSSYVARVGGYTVGVLVQSNFGGILTINGAPVGEELGQSQDVETARCHAGVRYRNAD